MAEEGFHDYTLATKLERLVAQLEQCFRGWLLTGLENISHLPPALGPDKQPINLVRVSSNINHRMPWRAQPYILTLHVPYTREADLQAARQRQQEQQQQRQQQQQVQVAQAAGLQSQQQQQQVSPQKPLHKGTVPPVVVPGSAADALASADTPGAAAAAPADDRVAVATAASQALARHLAAAAAAGQGSDAMQQLQAQLAPLLSSTSNNNGDAGNQQQLQQQVEDLIQQYHQLHLQLQQDGEQQQQQQQEDFSQSTPLPAEISNGGKVQDTEPLEPAGGEEEPAEEGSAGSATAFAAAAATAARDALSGLGAALGRVSSSGGGSGGGGAGSEQPTPPVEAALEGRADGATGSKGGKKLRAKKLQRGALPGRSSSSGVKTGSSASPAEAQQQGTQPGHTGALTAASDEGLDEATSRQVELPAPEQLVAADSKALAAVKAAVQLDHSRTAASRTWWPFCFDLRLVQQQLQSQPLLRLPTSGLPSAGLPWWSPGSGANKVQRWFGLDLFVLLQPASYSRRFLDAAESSSLLSVARLAASSCGVCWPLLLPVHDALRDAYVGVAQVGALSVWFHTDSIHISRLPRHLSGIEQQLSLLAEQLIPHNPAAAAACLVVLGQQLEGSSSHPGTSPFHSSPARSSSSWLGSSPLSVSPGSQHIKQQQGQQQLGGVASQGGLQYGVWLSACFTYRLPDASKRFGLQQLLSGGNGQHSIMQAHRQQTGLLDLDQRQQQQQVASAGAASLLQDDEESDFLDWDADTAWHPWAQYKDPIQVLELDIVWQDRQLVADSTEPAAAAEAGFSTATAAADAASAEVEASTGVEPHMGCSSMVAVSPTGMAAVLNDVACADVWLLHVLTHGFSSAPTRSGRLGVKSSERHRRHVRVEAAGADWLWTAEAAHQVLAHGGRLSGVCPLPWGVTNPGGANLSGQQLDPGSFTTMLSALMTARTAATAAHNLWELAGADWWEARGEASPPPLPPDSVLDGVLRDLLSPPRTTTTAAAPGAASSGRLSRRSSRESAAPSGAMSRSSSGVAQSTAATPRGVATAPAPGTTSSSWQSSPAELAGTAAGAGADGVSVQLPRSAPPGSLLCRLALHALVFGNARAIAALWQRLVMQARLQFWEQRTLLPYLPAGQAPNSTNGSNNSSSSGRANSLGSSSSRNSFSLQGTTSSAAGSTAVSAFAAAAGNAGAAAGGGAGGGGPPAPDPDSSLVHQKLQMLNICIWRRDKRLARGLSSRQQKQQQALRSRHASSSSLQGGKGSNGAGSAAADDADSTADDAGGAAGGNKSSGKLSGLATAASSTFYSVAGDEEDEDVDAAVCCDDGGDGFVAAGGDENDAGAVPADGDAAQDTAEENSDDAATAAAGMAATGPTGNNKPQVQQSVPQDQFEDASSEFYSAAAGGVLSGSGTDQEASTATAAAALAQAACYPDAEPQGVAAVMPGQFLLLYPDRPLRVPVVQDDPVFTEDQIIHRQMALMQLVTAAAESSNSSSTGSGRGKQGSSPAELLLLKQRLLAAPLLSDMCAFKAANPGCSFGDFLRWYSPKDWQQQQDQPAEPEKSLQTGCDAPSLSTSSQGSSPTPAQQPSCIVGDKSAVADTPPPPPPSTAAAAGGGGSSESVRMLSGPSNDWQQLWLLAEPQPAAAQRPLLNPHKEGELVLHYLETISPLALFSQLLAAAVCEALALLAGSRGAALPAAAAVVQRFHSMASSVLRKGGGLSEALAAADTAAGPPGREQQQQHVLAGDWQGAEDGLSDVELELMLAEFSYVEQVVVLAESLLHHLPGQPALAARLLQHLLHGAGNCTQSGSSTQHQQGYPSSDSLHQDPSAAAAAECGVLGSGSRLPVACLTWEERAALLRWVSACVPQDQANNLQRELSCTGSRQQQPRSGEAAGLIQGHDAQDWPFGTSSRSSSRQDTASSPTSTAGSHLQGLTSPRGNWPASGHSGVEVEGLQQAQEQVQAQVQHESPLHLQELRRLQEGLGQPAQREWVTTCAPLPYGMTPNDSSSDSSRSHSAQQKASRQPEQQQPGQGARRRLKPAVAAAVAALSGGPAAAAAGQSSVVLPGGSSPPVPPSRLFVQEADAEMRLATVLVTQQGL